MLHIQLFSNVKVLATIILVVMLVGCGGGRATTTSASVPIDTNPAPSDNPGPPAPGGNGSATLSWTAPTTYTDDTVLTELGGHNIYIDNGKGYTKLISIDNPSISTYIVENLSPGTYSLVVTAFDSNGMESAFSNTASFTISS